MNNLLAFVAIMTLVVVALGFLIGFVIYKEDKSHAEKAKTGLVVDRKIDLGRGGKIYPEILVVADGYGYWHTVSLDDYFAVNLNDSVSIDPDETVKILKKATD